LSGEAIPFVARIVSVVDAYVALTDERVYRRAVSHEDALTEIKRCSGSQFDPSVVEAFVSVVEGIHAGEDTSELLLS